MTDLRCDWCSVVLLEGIEGKNTIFLDPGLYTLWTGVFLIQLLKKKHEDRLGSSAGACVGPCLL